MHEGHHDAASRRLSDIGEMGEEDLAAPYRQEVFVKSKNAQGVPIMPARRSSRVLDSPVSFRDADNVSEGTVSEEAPTRAHSSSSGSTISGASETSSWDETKGRADYVAAAAQESRGSRSERERRVAPEPSNGGQVSANAPATNDESGPDEDASRRNMESEAERILENAKKRLTVRVVFPDLAFGSRGG